MGANGREGERMTIDERVNDVMAKLRQWINAGAHKPYRWDDEKGDFVYVGDDELRRFIIEKIVEAGRSDGIEEEREACAMIAETIRARELTQYNGRNCPFDTIAEEIRDRIQMRPATSNKDWSEL